MILFSVIPPVSKKENIKSACSPPFYFPFVLYALCSSYKSLIGILWPPVYQSLLSPANCRPSYSPRNSAFVGFTSLILTPRVVPATRYLNEQYYSRSPSQPDGRLPLRFSEYSNPTSLRSSSLYSFYYFHFNFYCRTAPISNRLMGSSPLGHLPLHVYTISGCRGTLQVRSGAVRPSLHIGTYTGRSCRKPRSHELI